MYKKLLACVVILSTVLSLNSYASASESKTAKGEEFIANSKEIENAEDRSEDTLFEDVDVINLSDEERKAINILYENGYSENDLINLSLESIKYIADELNQNPKSVSVNTQVQVIDNIESIELIVNLSEDELVEECHLTCGEAKNLKAEIEKLQNMTASEMKEKFNLSKSDLEVIEEALSPQEHFEYYKKSDKELTVSSPIGESYLVYSQIVTDASSGTAPKYKVICNFNWKKPSMTDVFSDTIAIAWGGNLNYNSSSTAKLVSYYNRAGLFPNFTFGKHIGDKRPTATEKPNKGILFSFSQMYQVNVIDNIVKTGRVSFELQNTQFKNLYSNIVSQYCHRVVSVSSASISLSGAPSISVGGAYETTDTDKTSTRIKY